MPASGLELNTITHHLTFDQVRGLPFSQGETLALHIAALLP